MKCVAQGHNKVPLVRLEPATTQSEVKHSSTTGLLSDLRHIVSGQSLNLRLQAAQCKHALNAVLYESWMTWYFKAH